MPFPYSPVTCMMCMRPRGRRLFSSDLRPPREPRLWNDYLSRTFVCGCRSGQALCCQVSMLLAPWLLDAGSEASILRFTLCCRSTTRRLVDLELSNMSVTCREPTPRTEGRIDVDESFPSQKGDVQQRCQKAWALSNQKWIFRARENDVALN